LLNGVVFIAAFTARSQAYAQAMTHAGLAPMKMLTYGARGIHEKKAVQTKDQRYVRSSSAASTPELFLPDLSERLLTTVRREGWDHSHTAIKDVNDANFIKILFRFAPKLVIYSGYGGQIIAAQTLARGVPFLHMHAGWLPKYRGSTTIYYSLLEGDDCGVSAILLNARIDEGPLVSRQRYPAPPSNIDVDSLYDNAIRADLLVKVLRKYKETGVLPACSEPREAGDTYFVIHPVLKHIALLAQRNNAER
tara:strand:+ start:2384 stop:3133 length:750 start_codon:yes stop_codon:yes gene_type:complete